MKPIQTVHLSIFSALLVFSCSKETSEEASGGMDDREPAPGTATETSTLPQVEEDSGPEVESNYSAQIIDNPAIPSIDQESWEKFVEYDEENRGVDSRTGKFIEGRLKVFAEDGSLASIYNFQEGLPHGRWEDYHPNGVVSMVVTYVRGVKEGPEMWQTEEGVKTYEVNFKAGEMVGPEIMYDENGSILSEVHRFESPLDPNATDDGVLDDAGIDLDEGVEEPEDEEPAIPVDPR